MVQQSPAGYRPPLLARAHLRLALWTWQLNEHELRALDAAVIHEVLADLRVASEMGSVLGLGLEFGLGRCVIHEVPAASPPW